MVRGSRVTWSCSTSIKRTTNFNNDVNHDDSVINIVSSIIIIIIIIIIMKSSWMEGKVVSAVGLSLSQHGSAMDLHILAPRGPWFGLSQW